MSTGEPFCCNVRCELGCEFAALPPTHQRRAVADRSFDPGDLHAARELIQELLCCRVIDVRELVADATPLRGSKAFWKAKITTTTVTTSFTV